MQNAEEDLLFPCPDSVTQNAGEEDARAAEQWAREMLESVEVRIHYSSLGSQSTLLRMS